MRFLLAFLALVAFANVDLSARADTQRRVALVIGNSAYKYVNKLPNPANDAAAVAAMLKSVGFDVIESKTNLTITQMKKAIRDFTEQTRGADIGVIYYAGHGIEVDGTNYMIPVDAELARDIDIEDEAVSLDRIVKVLEPARRLRLVILDACRDNPFSRTMQRTVGTRSIGRGLAKIEVQTSDTLIAFAAKAGSTATDGDGTNSPFTTALTKNLATPGLDLRLAFGQVRDDVLRATANRQEPFVYGSLGGSTVALVPAPQAAASQAAAPAAQADIRQDYQLAERIGTKEAWEQFLSIYDKGFYAGLARAARDNSSPKNSGSPQSSKQTPRARRAHPPSSKPRPRPRPTRKRRRRLRPTPRQKRRPKPKRQHKRPQRKPKLRRKPWRRLPQMPRQKPRPKPKRPRSKPRRSWWRWQCRRNPPIRLSQRLISRPPRAHCRPSCAESAVIPATPRTNGPRTPDARLNDSIKTPEPNSTLRSPASIRSMQYAAKPAGFAR